ncbi:MAG TPA: DUF6457 domain-containing protein [Solirubrobacteraceae bacterium]|nr:DUF6457 domain-containing protein [Solirubrobacteraceae bacterium]
MTDARTDLIEALAKDLGSAPLSQPEIDAILSLAAVAAHGTGDRTAAPLASFLAGVAAAGADSRVATIDRARKRAGELSAPGGS